MRTKMSPQGQGFLVSPCLWRHFVPTTGIPEPHTHTFVLKIKNTHTQIVTIQKHTQTIKTMKTPSSMALTPADVDNLLPPSLQ